MRSSSAGSLCTARRVGTIVSDSPRAAACGANSARMRAKSGASATSIGSGVSTPASRRERSMQLRELDLERVRRRFDMRDERTPLGIPRPRGERCDVQAERVQRLAQVVARGGQQLALRAIRGFRRRARIERASRAILQLADQVDVLVANRERAREHVVQPMAETDDEREHDAHHAGDEPVDLVADACDAHDQRHERRQHESVERRLVDGREVEAAERRAEQAHDQQRLVRRRCGKHRDGGAAPQRTGDGGTRGPIAAPARRRSVTRAHALERAHQCRPPQLVERDQCTPRDHRRCGDFAPHRDAEDDCAEPHRDGCQMTTRVERGDLVGARSRDQRRRNRSEGRHLASVWRFSRRRISAVPRAIHPR